MPSGSDAAISEEEGEMKAAIKRCTPGELIEVPAYVSPIAIIYNLPEVESLQLSPETLAKIFNQEIATWNDKAIAADNLRIGTSVVHSPVHRPDRLNFVGIRAFDARGVYVGETQLLGLPTASAEAMSARDIPVLRR